MRIQNALLVRDSTQTHRAEEARSYLAAIVDSSDDAIIGKTLDGIITTWNTAAERLYGYTAHETCGRSIAMLAPPDLADETPVLLERLRRGERIRHYETERLHKDGRRLIVSLSLSPVQDAAGSIVGAAVIARDMTERRQHDAALQRYQLLAQHANEIVLFVGQDGHILDCNAAALVAYGFERNELLQLSHTDLRAPQTQPQRGEQMERAASGGVIFESIHQRKDGSTFPVEVSWVGAAIGTEPVMLGIVRDITERRAAEAEVRLQGAALHAAANAIVITDREGSIQWVNPAFGRLTGYTLDEIQGKTTRVLKSGRQPASFYVDLWGTILAGQVWRGQLDNRRKDGTTYIEEMTITPVRDTGNAISHFVAIKEDVTERLQAAAAMREAMADMQAAQHIARLGSWELDLTFNDEVNRNTLRWSDECFRIFGYRPGEVKVSNELFFERVHPNDRQAIAAAVERTIQQGVPYSLEHRLVLRDGMELVVREEGSVVSDVSGRSRRLVGTVQDITEPKRIEAELARRLVATQDARVQAEAAVRSRDEFLVAAAHELKTPLTSLLTSAQILLRGLGKSTLDPDLYTRRLRTIDEQTRRMSGLVSRLLDISRIQAGKLALDPQFADLSELVSKIVASNPSAYAADQVLVRASGPAFANVDPPRIEQVLINLLDNAVKFSPGGEPIQVEVLPVEAGMVRLVVRDHGIGIPVDKRDKIFHRFYQAHASEHRSGLGLGLYISREIVELHGGRISVGFPPDGGTRFIVELPAWVASDESVDAGLGAA